MKRILSVLALVLVAAQVFAQAPQKMTYLLMILNVFTVLFPWLTFTK